MDEEAAEGRRHAFSSSVGAFLRWAPSPEALPKDKNMTQGDVCLNVQIAHQLKLKLKQLGSLKDDELHHSSEASEVVYKGVVEKDGLW